MTTDPTHIHGVVVGVDASHHAARAADWAAGEAVARGAALHVLHALDTDPGSALFGFGYYPTAMREIDKPGERLLAEIKGHLHTAYPGLEVVTELVAEPAAAALVRASREAQLVVVGTRGRGGFAGLTLGSVSARLVAHAHCPTVVLRAHEHDHGGGASGEIVLGMQPHEAEEPILFAFTQAARAGVGLRALHAWAPYPAHAQEYLSETDILARQAAERMVADLAAVREKFPDVPVTITAHRGHPSAVLADASAHAGLVVVGAHRHRAPLALGLGPIIHGLLGHAHSPVAVVPIPEAE